MEKFLTAKHWQLFLILVLVPIILFMSLVIFGAISQNVSLIISVVPAISLLHMLIFFSWFYSIGTYFHKYLPNNVRLNLKTFHVFLIIPVSYIILIFLSMIFAYQYGQTSNGSNSLIENSPGIIVPLHLFSMFCIFYCLRFISKTIKSIELNREAKFGDYAGEFFLIWFFPIGIWIVQPKINEMVQKIRTAANITLDE